MRVDTWQENWYVNTVWFRPWFSGTSGQGPTALRPHPRCRGLACQAPGTYFNKHFKWIKDHTTNYRRRLTRRRLKSDWDERRNPRRSRLSWEKVNFRDSKALLYPLESLEIDMRNRQGGVPLNFSARSSWNFCLDSGVKTVGRKLKVKRQNTNRLHSLSSRRVCWLYDDIVNLLISAADLHDIRRYQREEKLVIPQLAFRRVVMEIMKTVKVQ